jgi:transmembrane 9 superfamily protein 2/4
MHAWAYTVLLAVTLPLTSAFYLPGAAPTDYHEGEQVPVFVNALTPMLSGSDDPKLVSHFSVMPQHLSDIAAEITH